MKKWNVFFVLVLKLITNSYATDVGGIISSNTVWTLANSPYIAKSNLLLESGIELIIEPGVKIKFDPNVGFWVNGILKAEGTATQKIYFTSNQLTPSIAHWKGLLFDGVNVYLADSLGNYLSGSILKYCVIEYVAGIEDEVALVVHNSECYLDNIMIRECSNHGLKYVTAESSKCIIRNCSITGSNRYAFELRNKGLTKIINCNIYNNNYGLISTALDNCITYIDSCNFYQNLKGFTCDINKTVNIANCHFYKNDFGLILTGYGYETMSVMNSYFYENDIGIYSAYSGDRQYEIAYCALYSNKSYNIKTSPVQKGFELNAINNWWGTIEESEIENSIYDYYDSFDYRKVIFKPYLTEPVINFIITLFANDGVVFKNPDQVNYLSGSTVVITAVPNPGYSFTGWSGDASGSTNPLTVTMDANKTITANFELEQTNPVVKINLRAFLQGCYNAELDQMSTLLNADSYIPHTSPYCEDQCTDNSIPIDVTDWVLVQLFNSVNDAPLVSKSAFLRRDGYLVDTDGNIGINVEAQPGNYFVGLAHRNHLTIITSSAITLNNEGILYDFTTNADKCYGGNSSVEVEPGIWGMWAGDINHDGNITTKDYTIWFEADRKDLAGYQISDVNGDAKVDDLDYSIWLSNAQKGPNSIARLYSECYKVTDIDGNAYNTVKIGDQWWITENLKVTHYRNGDNIPNVTDASEWATLATGAHCNYNNDAGNIATYGRLYNWYSINDPRGLAPEGWHIPNDGEWQVLADYLGGNAIAGGKLKERGTFHWASPNTGATDDYGFCAVPNGYRNFDGIFYDMSISALFWTSTIYNSGNSLGWYPRYEYTTFFQDHHPVRNGFAIRCVKD